MWAFAWLDRRTNTVWLARDRFGEKPLFWCHTDEEVVFASEIATLRSLSSHTPAVNYDQIYRYLVNGYKSLNKSTDSFYDGIYRVEPGSWIRIDADLSVERGRYWDLKFNPQQKMKFADAVAETRWRLEVAVTRTMQADVPIAFSLSGGVDSNALLFLAKYLCQEPIRAFTIQTRDSRYDETDSVRRVLASSDVAHEFVRINREHGLERLRKLVERRSSPISTISHFMQRQLYEAMAKSGVKVAISGTAADEIFTGYYDHHLLYFAAIKNHRNLLVESIANWTRHIKPHVRNPFLTDANLFIDRPVFREHIYLESERFAKSLRTRWSEKFDERNYCSDILRNRMMNELFHEATPVILFEDDINAMSASIENRSPYLDRELVEFVFTIPTPLLIRDGYTKSVLREAIKDFLPMSVKSDYHKVGFNATITDLFDFKSDGFRSEVLSDSEVFSVVSRDYVETLLDNPTLQNSASKFLFNVLNIKMFLEQQ
jgi:asparagine synthase (glutamine-hydrolysing)